MLAHGVHMNLDLLSQAAASGARAGVARLAREPRAGAA
jgi:hypothetical protein